MSDGAGTKRKKVRLTVGPKLLTVLLCPRIAALIGKSVSARDGEFSGINTSVMMSHVNMELLVIQ